MLSIIIGRSRLGILDRGPSVRPLDVPLRHVSDSEVHDVQQVETWHWVLYSGWLELLLDSFIELGYLFLGGLLVLLHNNSEAVELCARNGSRS
jgi:hypothetical protein